MWQTGDDLCNLPEVDGFKYLFVSIDYFSNWSEARVIKDKSVPTFANFLFKIVCRHRCIKLQTNDQCEEFVNQIPKSFHKMTGQSKGLLQRITHSQMAYVNPK